MIESGARAHRVLGAVTLALWSCLLAVPAAAQHAEDAAAARAAFRPLNLPTPNAYRSADGSPGPRYWQQRADYVIQATLDTATQSIRGTETIHYRNDSPDTLELVWLYVEQNLYRPGSEGSYVYPANTRFGDRGFQGGMEIRTASVDGKSVEPAISDTRMRLDLPGPLQPGKSIQIRISWSFPIPQHGSDRMGRRGSLYEIAQWYPRMAVYDDVRGWNTDPYLGLGEFFLEYGDFDVSVTAPAGFVVAATGTLQNPGEVLTEAERSRLERARESTQKVEIIGPDEVGKATTRPRTSGTLTWHFVAKNVRDVVWAASPKFLWDAQATRGTLCQAFYEPDAADAWRTASDMTCFSIRHFSDRWFPYPYPAATSVAGLVGGMEYPMVVFVHSGGEEKRIFETINHELGHQWFPMVVGSNERRFFWQDEGLNTFIDGFNVKERYPDSKPVSELVANYDTAVAQGIDLPSMTVADRIPMGSFGEVSYTKPALALRLLREEVLGPERFDRAFRTYIHRWAYKHPRPADFFRTMESVAGADLDWFWREWFYTAPRLDESLTSVAQQGLNDGSTIAQIVLATRPGMVMPVDMRLFLEGGRTVDVRLPVQIWYHGPEYVYTLRLPKSLVGVEIDPDHVYPDQDRLNDVWGQTR